MLDHGPNRQKVQLRQLHILQRPTGQKFSAANDIAQSCRLIQGLLCIGGASSVFLMKNYSDSRLINVGTGQEVAIGELSRKYARSSDTKGNSSSIRQNPTACRASCSNSSRILQLGWRPTIPLRPGPEPDLPVVSRSARVADGLLATNAPQQLRAVRQADQQCPGGGDAQDHLECGGHVPGHDK